MKKTAAYGHSCFRICSLWSGTLGVVKCWRNWLWSYVLACVEATQLSFVGWKCSSMSWGHESARYHWTGFGRCETALSVKWNCRGIWCLISFESVFCCSPLAWHVGSTSRRGAESSRITRRFSWGPQGRPQTSESQAGMDKVVVLTGLNIWRMALELCWLA